MKDDIPFREQAEEAMLVIAKKEYARLVQRIGAACPQLSRVDGFPFVSMKVEGRRAVIFVQGKDGRDIPVKTFEVVGRQDEWLKTDASVCDMLEDVIREFAREENEK